MKQQAKSGVGAWLWAGVAALLLLMVYSAWDEQRMRNELRNVNGQATTELLQRLELAQRLAMLQREKSILTDPASVRIPLRPVRRGAAVLEATWHSKLGIVISGQKVFASASGRMLQLWLIPKDPTGMPIPSLTIRPDAADGKLFLLVENPPGAMENTKALTITEEPAEGSAQPTTPPQWVGKIN